ncbi:HPP family protein [Rhodococcus sp. 11-3]|uniref:HPP family protein n=1 Tax=Rhodococcus sp. 11-3 TaxID=2854796 RepID=UPI00203D9754|nr:HPP family protein [Rhodococcus sp. 11-3]USC17439.1 HPP family protein [Rhodococcus sp. 11-3]
MPPLLGDAPDGSRRALAAALAPGAVALGAAGALAALENLAHWAVFGLPYVASAALIALAPGTPAARPGAIVRAYPAAAAAALVVAAVAGPSQAGAAVAAGLAVVAMALLRAPHVPAAVCAGAIGLTDPGIGYVGTTLVPALLVVLDVATVAGRVLPGFVYPARVARAG